MYDSIISKRQKIPVLHWSKAQSMQACSALCARVYPQVCYILVLTCPWPEIFFVHVILDHMHVVGIVCKCIISDGAHVLHRVVNNDYSLLMCKHGMAWKFCLYMHLNRNSTAHTCGSDRVALVCKCMICDGAHVLHGVMNIAPSSLSLDV
jgi:hypothetical protein